jgi:translation elongation factor EF-G
MAARPAILEPIMLVELKAPIEFQGSIIGDINRLVWQQEISSAIPLLAEVEMLHNDYTMEL